jgi:hypothetical protein
MRGYPVSMNGAPVSQYLIWYRHMANVCKPKTVVFLSRQMILWKSLWPTGCFPDFIISPKIETGAVSLKLSEYYRCGLLGRIASLSSLVPYVLTNLDGISILSSLVSVAKPVVAEQAHEQLAASATSNTETSGGKIIDKTARRKGIGQLTYSLRNCPARMRGP